MLTTIRNHRYPLLGMCVLAASVVLLFVDFPGDWKVFHIVLFIAGWSVGCLLIWGVIGTHPLAAEARRVAPSQPLPVAVNREAIKPELFQYGTNRWRRGMVAGFVVVLGLGMATLGVVCGVAWHAQPAWVGLAVGAGCITWGMLICDYGRRYLRVGIAVDDTGIRAQLYYRSIVIPWDEVVALIEMSCRVPMIFAGIPAVVDAGVIYWVYSGNDKIWFSNSLVDGDRLRDIIAERTGLVWKRD